jgi:hypothetical protein
MSSKKRSEEIALLIFERASNFWIKEPLEPVEVNEIASIH